jgi:hypothetical protein
MVADDSKNANGGLTVHNNIAPSGGTVAYKTSDICLRPPADRRIDGGDGFLFSTTEPLEALDPWYVTVDNLAVVENAGDVDLSWDAGTKLDASRGSIEYSVLRSTTNPPDPATDVIIEGLTSTTYTDTTAVAGVTYYYRIHARLYWDGFLPYDDDGYLPAAWQSGLFGTMDLSNVDAITLDGDPPAGVLSVSAGGKAPRV